MTCKYCFIGYWVATILALGAFAFCMTLTEGFGWELSTYCWMLKGLMLSIGLVLATGFWMKDRRANYTSAWVLSLVGLSIAVWQNLVPQDVCTLDCDRAIFALSNFGVTPLIMATTLFAILLAMTSTMIVRNKN